MPDPTPIPAKILAELNAVQDQVSDLFGHWNFFNGLFADQESVDILKWAFNYGAAGLIYQAVRTEIAVGIGRLLDPAVERRDTLHNLSVERMVNHVKDQRPEKAVGLEDELKKVDIRFKPLRKWRDKHHAHRDYAVAMGIDPIAQVDKEAVESVLSALGELMNRICSALNHPIMPYQRSHEAAATQLLAFVLPKYQASRKR